MTNQITRRDFVKAGLIAALAGTALGSFYPLEAKAQGNLGSQVRDIEKYVRQHATGHQTRGVVPTGGRVFLDAPSAEYDGLGFQVAAHDYGILTTENTGVPQRLFYDSRDTGLGTLDTLIEIPTFRDLEDESVRAFLFGSDAALTSLARTTDQRREDREANSVWDRAVIKRKNPNGRVNVYDFPNRTGRHLSAGESRTALNEMQNAYREVVERVYRDLALGR